MKEVWLVTDMVKNAKENLAEPLNSELHVF